jgi:hypothetical protein
MTSGMGVSVGVAVALTSASCVSPSLRATGASLPTQQWSLTYRSSLGAAETSQWRVGGFL